MATAKDIVVDAGTSLFVEIAGQGPPLLMVAGLGDDHTVFEPLVAQMEDHFTCITYDHRGSGASSPLPEYADIATLAEDGHRLLEELGFSEVVVIGCSLGGAVVQEWALRYPDDFSKLVLMSAFARPHRRLRATLDHWEALYQGSETQRLVESIALSCFSADAWDNQPDLIAEVLTADELAPGFLTQLRAGKGFDAAERIGGIQHPVLIVAGDADMLVSTAHAEELADLLPDASLQFLPYGHVPFWEAPEETAAVFLPFCE